MKAYKKEIFLTLVLGLAIITGCNKSDPVEAQITDKNAVSLSAAVRIAYDFANTEKSIVKTRSSGLTIKEAFSIQDNKAEPYIHIINFESGGFVAVSGDNRMEPILAYSDNSVWDNSPDKYPLGLKQWIEGTRSVIDSFRLNNTQQTTHINRKWQSHQNEAITRSLDPESGVVVEVDSTVGPLIFDSWHRYEPYNDSLSLQPHGPIYVKPTVGCVPLSIARIVRYHSYPTTYPWSSILDDGSFSPATKLYLKNVFDNVKGYCDSYGYLFYQDYEYGAWNTYVERNLPVSSLINVKFGGWEGTEMSYNPSNIAHVAVLKNELLKYSRPVILAGDDILGRRHMWVCDGCHYKVEVEYDDFNQPVPFTFTFFHHRWGEIDNDYDGWFVYSNMTAGTQNFNNSMTLSYNLYPL